MDETTLQFIAQQLRQPSGEPGRDVGEKMNVGNEHVNRAAIAALRVTPQDRILEVGMGNGAFVSLILSVDPSVRYVGCDFSETMVEEAIRRNESTVASGQAQVFVAPAEALPFADGSFDKAFTVNTVYFWETPALVLAEFRRVLKPGGHLFIAGRPRRVMEALPFVRYGFTLYSAQELSGLLRENGFSVTEILEKPEPNQTFGGVALPMETMVVSGATK
ncbi:MAG: class I SAM-dependent methyltransferase [Sphingobacteriaceae bacterium]|nr:class I SAM-dependent methyltransferase [Cytophagaceae bacterium]